MTEPTETLPAELLNARVHFWMCINRDHKSVTWDGDVATCPDCGVTSEMTVRYAERIRDHLAGRRSTTQPGQPMSTEARAEIAARDATDRRALGGDDPWQEWATPAQLDRHALLHEVDRLREELAEERAASTRMVGDHCRGEERAQDAVQRVRDLLEDYGSGFIAAGMVLDVLNGEGA